MKITESKLREMIRGVIREFVSSSTGTGGASQHKGRQSAATKAAKRSLDTKKSDYDTKSAIATSKKKAVNKSKQFRMANKAQPGTYLYSGIPKKGFTLNPDYTQQVQDKSTADTAKTDAKTARDSAQTTFDSAKEDDLQKSTPTQKPPSGGGAGFGKGKSAGKGKGKKKKN